METLLISINRYQARLAARPLLTQSITTGVSVSLCPYSMESLAELIQFALFSGYSGPNVVLLCPRDADYHYDQLLFATGDVLAQQAVEQVGVEKHNLARTGRMALYGGGQSFPCS